MTQSVLLVLATMLATWLVMRWLNLGPAAPKLMSSEEREIGRAKDVGRKLDGARDRASLVEEERNKLALAKAVKAALWVTESRLNRRYRALKTPVWVSGKNRARNGKRRPRHHVEGLDDVNSPWAAWNSRPNWRVRARRPSILPKRSRGYRPASVLDSEWCST